MLTRGLRSSVSRTHQNDVVVGTGILVGVQCCQAVFSLGVGVLVLPEKGH
jgi:hypothetical protein